MKLFAKALLDAIMPSPDLDAITKANAQLARHLSEPPRRRRYLCFARLS